MSYLLTEKLEEAFVSLLTAPAQVVDAACLVVTSGEITDKTLPLVGAMAEDDSAEEDPKGSGNFWVSCTVTVRTRAVKNQTGDADPAIASDALVSAVHRTLLVDDLAAQLSAAATSFTVFPASITFHTPTNTQDGDAWISDLKMRLLCCASDIVA